MNRWGIIRDGALIATVLHPVAPTSSVEIGIDLDGATVVALDRVPDPRFETVSAASGAIEVDNALAAEAFEGIIDRIFETRALALAVPEMKQRMHRRKEAEARLLVTSPEAETPMLSAEAALTGHAIAALAEVVIARADSAVAIDAAREAARRKAKLDVRDGADPAAMQSIVVTFRNEVAQWN